jgi:hypothetical protein
MADLGFDGLISVWWVATIANIAAPSAASEIGNASTVVLHTRLTPDGLATGAGSDTIDTSKMSSTFNTKIVGRRNFDGLQLKYVRGDAVAEALLDTTLIYKATGIWWCGAICCPPPRRLRGRRWRCTRRSVVSRSTTRLRRTPCRR